MSRRKLLLTSLSIVLLFCTASAAKADVITFSVLAGANENPYAGHVEGGYTVTPTAGNWFEAHMFGNPTPSIFAGPIGSPTISTIQVTGPGLFTFSSVALASNNGTSTFLFQGFVGAAMVFSTGGVLASNAGFLTFNNTFSLVAVDRLLIQISPTSQPSSMNLDNITVFRAAAVPEPTTILLLGTGLAGIASKLRKRRGHTR